MHQHSPLFALHLSLTDSIARRPRVLVVDDEPEAVALAIDVLEPEGYEVLGASSARDAFRAMATSRPDVVLLDLKMPGLDGAEALSRIYAVYPEAPVIVVTANGNEEVAADTLRRGAFSYVAKPFDIAHLRSVVQLAVAVRADRAATRAVLLGGQRGLAA